MCKNAIAWKLCSVIDSWTYTNYTKKRKVRVVLKSQNFNIMFFITKATNDRRAWRLRNAVDDVAIYIYILLYIIKILHTLLKIANIYHHKIS